MRTMHWNGERWYEDHRSLWLRVRQWFIWVGGWESGGKGEQKHEWRLHTKGHPGNPVRVDPTPVSLFGHRITFFGWGVQVRLPQGYLTWTRGRKGFQQSQSKAYISWNGTPGQAHCWLWGWSSYDLANKAEEKE